MEIIPWALMEEPEYILKQEGWQLHPNSPHCPSQTHAIN